jgi:hypothetical protein
MQCSELRQQLRRCLADETVSVQQRLLALIRTVDLAYGRLIYQPDADQEALLGAVLAHATVAIAPLLTTAGYAWDGLVEATARAAGAYIKSPTEVHWTAFMEASTNSYPFGPGDGCLAVDELGGHGTPGAGDHGAGFIWFSAIIGPEIGPERVYHALLNEMDGFLAEQ